MTIDFQAWPKTPRLFRDIVITEKIDGTNAAVIVQQFPFGYHADVEEPDEAQLVFGPWNLDTCLPDHEYLVAAQSRKRVIKPGKTTDNFGFAAWVRSNAEALANVLGEGVHYGEWWGHGIQAGYGLAEGERRFSLFNVNRYAERVEDEKGEPYIAGLDVVPVMYEGPFELDRVRDALDQLRLEGSIAEPGFMRPEGVIVYHTAAGQVFKALLENDELPKGLAVQTKEFAAA